MSSLSKLPASKIQDIRTVDALAGVSEPSSGRIVVDPEIESQNRINRQFEQHRPIGSRSACSTITNGQLTVRLAGGLAALPTLTTTGCTPRMVSAGTVKLI
jgi:hypothetical protein